MKKTNNTPEAEELITAAEASDNTPESADITAESAEPAELAEPAEAAEFAGAQESEAPLYPEDTAETPDEALAEEYAEELPAGELEQEQLSAEPEVDEPITESTEPFEDEQAQGFAQKRAKKRREHRDKVKKAAKMVRAKGQTSIKLRILRISILSVCAAVLAMQVLTVVSTIVSYSSSYQTQAEALTTSYIQLLQTKIRSLTLELEGVRSNTAMTTVIDESYQLSTRKSKLSELCNSTMFKDITLADSSGDTYNETNIADREYFQRALDGINTMSSPLVRRTNNDVQALKDELVMFMAVRYKNVLFHGVLVGAVEPSFMSQGLDSMVGGTVVVLDMDGNVVAGSDLAQVMNGENYVNSGDSGLEKLAAAMLTQEAGTIKYSSGGTRYVASYSPIELTNGWTIAVSLDYTSIKQNIFANLVIALGIGLALIVGITLIGAKLADRIAHPVIMSADRLRKLSEGDISEEFYVPAQKDETRILADSLTETIRELGRYISDIKNVLAAIAGGDLTAHSTIEYKGDFAAISASLDSITASLNESISAVKESVDSIRDGSAQVADGSKTLSEAAAQEAAAVDGIMRTIDDIRRGADKTAEISAKVLTVTKEAADNASGGGELMKELSAAINNINEKSEAISAVIKTIDSIAFQTNILAINAAIEAARAGEAGRGFAVVAEEVGNLASMSADAVKQTAALITDSTNAVKQGTAIAGRAEEAIGVIVQDVNKVAKHMGSIVEAADEQKSAAALITESMKKIDNGMHSTTGTAERSAQSSEQLSELAVSLAAKVERFKTEN